MIYFTVDDIDEAHETLRGRGVEFDEAPHLIFGDEHSELWMAFFSDPDGNNLALMAERELDHG
jgi:extradiol dioxygenase family protein